MKHLHELLAVSNSVTTQADKVRTDLATSFEKKRHLFGEKRVVFQANAEGTPPVVESQSSIQTTVREQLGLLAPYVANQIDTDAMINEANTKARADIVLDDGTVLAKQVPATTLLELEKRIAEVQTVLRAVPTLDPAKGFEPDVARGNGILKARDVVKTRTKKTTIPVVLYPATDKHPAQVNAVQEDVAVGSILEQEWSGELTPAEKSALLDKAERVLRAVKAARARANTYEITDNSAGIGGVLIGYILK